MLELAVCAFAGLVALRHESDDWMKVERKRDDVLAGRGEMLDMVTQVERVRRVTWRMGVFVMAANSLFHGHLSFLPLRHLPNRCIMNYFNSMIPHC